MAKIVDNTPKPTLIFIPDISGFTEFVNDTEISHSQHIIQELLEAIIDSNTINLEISEIEGDAVLFYRMGNAPDAEELLRQVQKMYEEFHSHLKRYESQRICHCGACSTAHRLRLKFVAHYGELSTSKVKNFNKLFGRDLIIAHRLLKNKIDLDEYILVTRPLSLNCAKWDEIESLSWAQHTTGSDTYDFGEMEYVYMPLEPLYAHIPEPTIESFTLSDARSITRIEHELDAPIAMVFDVVSDVAYRHHWQPGLKGSTELNGAITHNGTSHRCVINNNKSDPFFNSHSFDAQRDSVTWLETDTVNNVEAVFRLEKIDENRTKVIQELFIKMHPIALLFAKPVIGYKLGKQARVAFDILSEYLGQLQREGRNHDTHVILNPVEVSL